MDVLIIEDDEFKAADITRLLLETIHAALIRRAPSVTSALRAISTARFDLVVLDMSLPTFDLSGPGGGGSPQGQGGVEVLRLAKRVGADSDFVIVTQYPDIEIDGEDIPLSLAGGKLASRFGLRVRACLPYEFDRDDWQIAFRKALSPMAQKRREV